MGLPLHFMQILSLAQAVICSRFKRYVFSLSSIPFQCPLLRTDTRTRRSAWSNSNEMRHKFWLKAYMASHKHQQTGLSFVLEPTCNKIWYLNLAAFYDTVGAPKKEILHMMAGQNRLLIQHISTTASISLQKQDTFPAFWCAAKRLLL